MPFPKTSSGTDTDLATDVSKKIKTENKKGKNIDITEECESNSVSSVKEKKEKKEKKKKKGKESVPTIKKVNKVPSDTDSGDKTVSYQMPNETESKNQELGMWNSFISSLSETQASHLHQLLLGKTKIGGSIKTENVPEKSLEENMSTDVPKINNEPEYKCEPQLQTCKKPECPVGGKPMGASYAAAELIKRNHRSKLKKHLFPDDKDGEEESLKVMP